MFPFDLLNIFLWTNTLNVSVFKSFCIEEKNTTKLVQPQHIEKHSGILVFQLLLILLCILHEVKCWF